MGQAAIKDTFDNLTKTFDSEFAKATSLAGRKLNINTALFKAQARIVSEQEALVSKKAQFSDLKALADDILKLPENMSFAQARAWQKRLGAKTAKLKNLPEGEMKLLFKGVSDSIDTLSTKNPAALTALNKAKEAFKKKAILENETILGDLLDKNPDDVISSLFKQGKSSNMIEFRQVVPPRDWPIFERAAADKLLLASGKSLENLGQMMNRTSRETLEATFRPETIQALTDIAEASQRIGLERVERMARGRAGFNLINMTQGGLMVNLALGAVPGSVAVQTAIVLTPPVLAKILTSETGAKLLSIGLKMPAGSREAVTLGSRLLGIVMRPESDGGDR